MLRTLRAAKWLKEHPLVLVAACVLALLLGYRWWVLRDAERRVDAELAARRVVIQAETHELKVGLIAERQALEMERQAAEAAKAEAERLKADAEKQTAELRVLLADLKRLDAQRAQAREEANRVPDENLVAAFRDALRRLRAGPGR